MFVKQLSVFLENKSGKIYEVASILEKAEVNIRALSLADTSDFGVLRLIVDKPEKAMDALKKNGLTVRITTVVAVEVEDRIGGFANVMRLMDEASINVEYMYAFVEKKKSNAILIFRFDDIENAVKTLLAKGLKILKEKEVLSL